MNAKEYFAIHTRIDDLKAEFQAEFARLHQMLEHQAKRLDNLNKNRSAAPGQDS